MLAENWEEVLGRPTKHARFRRSFEVCVETAGQYIGLDRLGTQNLSCVYL